VETASLCSEAKEERCQRPPPLLAIASWVASPDLEGEQVAVLRFHAAPSRPRNEESILLCEGDVCAPWHKAGQSTDATRTSENAVWAKFQEGRKRLLGRRGIRARRPGGRAQVLTLQQPPTGRAILHLLAKRFAPLVVIEEEPSVASPDPPELPPKVLHLPAWAIQLCHQLPPRYAAGMVAS